MYKMSQRRIFLFLLLFLGLGLQAGIKVVKQGGKKCGTNVCYDYIKDVIHNNGDREITCRNKGTEQCPSYGVVSVGDAQIDLNKVIQDVEHHIHSQQTQGQFDIYVNGQIVALCRYQGLLNSDGIADFEALIDPV